MYGHTKSIDLDLFTDQPLDKELLVNTLQERFERVVAVNGRFKSIYQCTIQNVKVDFVSVKYPFLYLAKVIEKIPFADIKDLIALKLNAVKGKDVKKDFWDVAELLQRYSMSDIFKFYKDRYPYDDTFAVIRSVIYFTDAEQTLDPEALNGVTWRKVKRVITKAFDNYYKKKN